MSKEIENKKMYALRFKWSDYSGSEPIRLYANRDLAVRDLNLLKEYGDESKSYFIEDLELSEDK